LVYYLLPVLTSVTVLVLKSRVADLNPGSGAFLTPLDPGAELTFVQFPNLGTKIPKPYFWELRRNLLGKEYFNSLSMSTGSNNFQFREIRNPGSDVQMGKIMTMDEHPRSATLFKRLQ
jgi:hypothetical protein